MGAHLTGDFRKMRALQRSLADLAKRGSPAQEKIAAPVRREIDAVLVEQFATGEGPSGPWQKTKRGRTALVSRRLPKAFRPRFDRGILRYVARTPRNWLQAHHEGKRFPARSRAAGAQFLSFNRKGRLVSAKRVINKKGEVRRGAYQIFARAHTVGARELPRREIYPTGALPSKWRNAIERGARAGLQGWAERATK